MARFNIAAWNRRHRRGRRVRRSRRGVIRMPHRRRGRRFRRSRRGTQGGRGMLGRIFHTVTTRPLKVVAAGFGIGAVASVFLSGSSTNDGVGVIGHVANGIAAAQQNDMTNVSFNFQAVPKDILAGVSSGQWIAPAVGAIVTGIISRKFRI